VEQMVKISNESDKFILTIAPEGTRHHVQEWKRGFYHIAKSAGIPIVMPLWMASIRRFTLDRCFTPLRTSKQI